MKIFTVEHFSLKRFYGWERKFHNSYFKINLITFIWNCKHRVIYIERKFGKIPFCGRFWMTMLKRNSCCSVSKQPHININLVIFFQSSWLKSIISFKQTYYSAFFHIMVKLFSSIVAKVKRTFRLQSASRFSQQILEIKKYLVVFFLRFYYRDVLGMFLAGSHPFLVLLRGLSSVMVSWSFLRNY